MPFQPQTSAAVFWGPLSQDQKETVLKNVRATAAQRFKKYRQTIKESLGLRDLTGPALLNAYRGRTPEIWANLQQHFPDEYGRQIAEWGKLEVADRRRVQQELLQSPEAKTSTFESAIREGV